MPEEKLLVLATSVTDWWETAQYDEAYPGRNLYDSNPEMVQLAASVLGQEIGEYGCYFFKQGGNNA